MHMENTVVTVNMDEVYQYTERMKTPEGRYEEFQKHDLLCDGSLVEVDELRYSASGTPHNFRAGLYGFCHECGYMISVTYNMKEQDTPYRLRYHTSNGTEF